MPTCPPRRRSTIGSTMGGKSHCAAATWSLLIASGPRSARFAVAASPRPCSIRSAALTRSTGTPGSRRRWKERKALEPDRRIMSEPFILIPGRTSKQGVGISEGKFKEGYLSETRTLLMAPRDMQRLGLKDDDRVSLRSEFGQIEVSIIAAKGDELPPGLLFIAYGDLSSRLMGGDTHGSGMPTSKGIDVELEVLR